MKSQSGGEWTWTYFISFRYNELLFIIDTCQGASMYERFYSPNIMALASSQVGEDSLSVSICFDIFSVQGI